MSRHRPGAVGNTQRIAGRTLLRFGLIASLAMALVITGAGVTFALWTSSATVTSEASTASLELSAENFSSTDFVFRNDRLASLSSVTITNTTDTASNTPADLKLELDTDSGSAALASAIAVSAWRVALGTDCSAAEPTGTVHKGTWALFPTIYIADDLEHDEQAKYCISSVPAEAERSQLAAANGTLTVSPRLTATLSVGSFEATAVRTASQATSYIFPATNQPAPSTWHNIVSTGPNNLCVDVEGGNGDDGTTIINYGCKNDSDVNQDWGLVTTSYDPRYVNIETRYTVGSSNPQHLVIGTVDAANTIEVQTLDPNSHDQQWQFQLRSTSAGTDTFQIVNRASGLCLQGDGTEIEPIREQQCDGSARQGFTLEVRQQQAPAIALACEASGSGVTYLWTGPSIEEYELGIAPDQWTFIPVKTVPFGAESIVVEPGDVPAEVTTGMHTVVAKWRDLPIGDAQLWVESAGAEPTLACDAETDIEVTAGPVSPSTIEAGVDTDVEWTFNVANHGPLSSGVEVLLNLPGSGYSVTSMVASCDQALCTIDSLAPGAAATVTVAGAVNTKTLGPWSVTATVALTGGVDDANDSNNEATGWVTVEDTTAPDAPTDLAFSDTTSQSTTLTWTQPNDNVGVVSYSIFRDGVEIATEVTETTYTDTDLSPAIVYEYTVTAVDEVPLESEHSEPASVTTADHVDLAPEVTCSDLGFFQDGFRLSWTATAGVQYFAEWRTSNDGEWTRHADAISSGQSFSLDGTAIRIGSGVEEIRIVAKQGGTEHESTALGVSYSWFFGYLAKCG